MLVVVPTDSASPEQWARYEQYAAEQLPRTSAPQEPARMMFAPDLVGSSEVIAERLQAHAAFREIDEVVRASFHFHTTTQILTDIALKLAPALG